MVAVVIPDAPSGRVSGLLAPGTAPAAPAPAVPVADDAEGSGVGMGAVIAGTSLGVQPTSSIAASAAAMLPVMKATRRVKVRRLRLPAR